MAKQFKSDSGFYILTLDSEQRMTQVLGFSTSSSADQKYLEMEKESQDKPHVQTVMVSLNSLKSLKNAYPSFYLDTTRFIRLIDSICDMVSTDEANEKA
jgi:putative GTP pyrophosphokinase